MGKSLKYLLLFIAIAFALLFFFTKSDNSSKNEMTSTHQIKSLKMPKGVCAPGEQCTQ